MIYAVWTHNNEDKYTDKGPVRSPPPGWLGIVSCAQKPQNTYFPDLGYNPFCFATSLGRLQERVSETERERESWDLIQAHTNSPPRDVFINLKALWWYSSIDLGWLPSA